MRLSRTVAYAVQAVMQLAEVNPSIPYPCSKLAKETKMPERFLLQILRQLVTHGILNSTRGVDGGYSLMMRPDQISLLAIIEAIDGPLISAVPQGEGISQNALMKLRDHLKDATDSLRKQLGTIKISELMGSPRRGRG
jgi:Rrf2 family protein